MDHVLCTTNSLYDAAWNIFGEYIIGQRSGSMMIVAFLGKEILSRFFTWVKNPTVEAAEFEFFDVISELSGDLNSVVICLYRIYSYLSKILCNVGICAWFGEDERCNRAYIFDVIHEHFMKLPESKIFLGR